MWRFGNVTPETPLDQDAVFGRWKAHRGPLIEIRAAVLDDAPAYAAFIDSLDYGTRYFRFGHGRASPSPDAIDRLCSLEANQGRCLLAVTGAYCGKSAQIIATADFHPLDDAPRECEMTIVVTDEWRGGQVAHRLLACLVQLAHIDGFDSMHALILATNKRMLRFMHRNGFVPVPGSEGGAIHLVCRQLDLSISVGPVASAAMDRSGLMANRSDAPGKGASGWR